MSRTILSLLAVGVLAATTSEQTFAQENSRKIVSRLEIYDVETGTRTVLKEYPHRIEAPNWTMDGAALVYNSGGRIYRIAVDNPASDVQIPTGDVMSCNNDHVLSADGTGLAISSGGPSRIYVLPIGGGTPQLITPQGPSYLHGWSPDGKMLTYTAERGNGHFDIYATPADGSGTEVRLTTAEGLDDGPEYSPNGKYIWFNSTRSGTMQVWRMRADGSKQTRITFDDSRNAWFPHVSPDGRRVVYIAYDATEVAAGDHPAGKNVELRMISARQGGEEVTVAKLFGGQGTINVNSWAPDSRRFAFVSYEYSE